MTTGSISCLAAQGGWGNLGVSGAEEGWENQADGIHCRKVSPREIDEN